MGDVIPGPWGQVSWRKGRPLPGNNTPDPARPASSAWAQTPSPSGLHCKVCERVFAAGALPTDGDLTCRDCRDDAAEPDRPSLF